MKPRIFLVLVFCIFTGCLAKPPDDCQHTGTVEYLQVQGVGEIGAYLPPCYDPHGLSRYPVLFLLPGAGGIDRSWFDGGLASVADTLILKKEIPAFIIITTDNTYELLNPARILDTLIPYVEAHFRVRSGRTWRAIAGSSLGGFTAYQLTFQHPDVFSSAGVFGNGLVIGLEAQTEAWLKAIPLDLKPRVFLNSGLQDTYMVRQARALIPLLDKYGIPHQEIFTTGGHSGDYWLSNFPSYLHWLAEDWK